MFKNEQIVIDSNNFYKVVLKSEIPVMVEVSARWSGGTHIIKPILYRIIDKYSGLMKFCNMNYDNNKNMVQQFGVTKLPAILIFINGQLEDVIIGAISYKELEEKVKTILLI